MTREFISTPVFDKRWAEMGLTDDDLQQLELFLMRNPTAGDIIPGTGGATKLRWNLPHTGKSGGARVIYVDLIRTRQIHFVTCYPKPKKETLSDNEKAAIKKVISRIKTRGGVGNG